MDSSVLNSDISVVANRDMSEKSTANSVEPDEMAHSGILLFVKVSVLVCRTERVKAVYYYYFRCGHQRQRQ